MAKKKKKIWTKEARLKEIQKSLNSIQATVEAIAYKLGLLK